MKLKFVKAIACPRSYSAVGDKHDYVMSAAKVGLSGLRTENINACIAGVVSAGKANLMFHLAPEQQSLHALEDSFVRKMDEFCSQAGTNDIDAFVCGGWESSSKDVVTAEQSIRLYNKVAELLEDWGAKLSLVCGKKQNELDGLYAREGRAILISDDWNKYGINCDELKTKTPEEVARLLENKYETVEIHPTHEFMA